MDELIKYGVALIGPGDPGPWNKDRRDEEYRGDSGVRGGFVRRFATEVKVGDVLVLRVGSNRIRAIGIVADEYEYLPQFDDVNGWDLQHARRVRWFRLPEDCVFEERVFGGTPSRLARVDQPEVLQRVREYLITPPTNWQELPLPPLPPIESALNDMPAEMGDIVARVHDLRRLYWDREHFGLHPTEDELITHFVVPLLRRLGWPSESIAIKWQDVDVAVFRKLPRCVENCHFIIEAKRLGEGLDAAVEQAKGYLSALGISSDLVVTDGFRYAWYGHERSFSKLAYANLDRLKISAPKLFELMRRPTS